MPIWKTRHVVAGRGAGSWRANAWQRFLESDLAAVAAGGLRRRGTGVHSGTGYFAVPDLLGGTDGIMIGNLIKQQFSNPATGRSACIVDCIDAVCAGAGRIGRADWPGSSR